MNALNLNFVSNNENIVVLDKSKCTIKWFKQEEGYGFVNHPSISYDIFLHESKIDNDCLPNIKPGQIILCTVVRGLRGPQVNQIFEYNADLEMITCYGTFKWFNTKQFFGFVSIDAAEEIEKQFNVSLKKKDIFVSIDVLRSSNITNYKCGTKVQCDFIIDANNNNIMKSMTLCN